MATAAKTDTLASAMAAAFAEIEGATKDKVNPAFKSKYADLGSVIDAIKPALVNHGLFFSQLTHSRDGGVVVETVVTHTSGEAMSFGHLFVPANRNDAQGYGSALTYARRYSLMAAFGVPAEDDDGNAAARTLNRANDTGELIDDAEWAQLVTLAEGVNADVQKFCAYMKVPDLKSIRKADFSRAVEALSAKKKAA